jgi:hypothetical protein
MNTYELTHTANCPNGELVDHYTIKIESAKAIQVEALISALSDSPDEIYQEDLTDWLRQRIPAKITTVGSHHGVIITCVRD